jgi:dTDP-4-dehydrorhamnose reductase
MIEHNLAGIFHVGGGQAISWFDFARMIFEEAGMNPELRPTSDREHRTSARRPRFSALSNAKMEQHGVTPMPPLRESVRAYMSLRAEMLSPKR